MYTEYMLEGYELMMNYMRKQRILTRERSFRRKLDKYYQQHKDQETLNLEEEKEYLQLEQYFYNNIIQPSSGDEMALTNMLNLLANIEYEKEE